MKVYLDVNVVMDGIFEDRTNHNLCKKIIGLGKVDGVELLVAPSTFVLVFFHIRKMVGNNIMARNKIKLLRKFVSSATSDEEVVDDALNRTPPGDLEDAYQIEVAIKAGADVLVTSDKKGFRNCPITALRPGAFLKDYFPSL